MCGRMFSEKYENSITSHIPRHPQLSITCSMESVRSLGMRLVVCGESLGMRLGMCGESLGMRLVYELYIKDVYYCH